MHSSTKTSLLSLFFITIYLVCFAIRSLLLMTFSERYTKTLKTNLPLLDHICSSLVTEKPISVNHAHYAPPPVQVINPEQKARSISIGLLFDRLLTSFGMSLQSLACLIATRGDPRTTWRCSISRVKEARSSCGKRQSDMHLIHVFCWVHIAVLVELLFLYLQAIYNW